MHTNRILMVVTSADHMGSSLEPTGAWLEEIAAPYYAFVDAKCEVLIASPLGGKTPLDPKGALVENQTASTRRFEADAKAQRAVDSTIKLATVEASNYDAVFFVGGHGTMEDFPKDASVKATAEAFYRAGKMLASVCHGPACLVNALKPSGEPLVKGHRFTCFSNEEEKLVGAENAVPFSLESRLKEQGGTSIMAPAFQPSVVVDRQLLTGQNPASSIPLAETMIYHLRQQVAA